MTDNKIHDIKELLEYKAKVGCQNCDLIGKGCCSTCVNSLIKSFIGLFDRLQAENERLKSDLKEIGEDYERLDNAVTNGAEVCHNCHLKYAEKIKQAKAEAYKEFADNIDKIFSKIERRVPDSKIIEQTVQICRKTIQIALKELVGE